MNDSYTRHACGVSAPSRLESAVLNIVGVISGVLAVANMARSLACAFGWA